MFMSNGQSSVFVDSDGGLTCWENSWLCWDYLMLITTPVIGDRWSIRLLGLGLLDVRCWDDMVIKGPIQAIHLPSCCLIIWDPSTCCSCSLLFVLCCLMTVSVVAASPDVRILEPEFNPVPSKMVYTSGDTARLFCSVSNLGERTVSARQRDSDPGVTRGF